MEAKGSLPCPQQPADGPYPEPDKISQHPHNIFLYNLIYPLATTYLF